MEVPSRLRVPPRADGPLGRDLMKSVRCARLKYRMIRYRETSALVDATAY